jgi:GT2 family glycosyltransferase
MQSPRVGIVILNYKTYKMTIECVNKLVNIDYENFFVVVIDNDSPNESFGMLKNEYSNNIMPFEIHVISSEKNGGYSYGNNIGAKKAEQMGAEFILIMNNDVELINSDFISELVNFMEKDTNVAMVGPGIIEKDKLQLPAFKGRPSGIEYLMYNTFFPLFVMTNKFKRVKPISNSPLKVYSVAGSCLMVKAKLFKEVNYYDDNVFLYGEELILGEKFYQANYDVYFIPSIRVDHKHSYTIDNSFKITQKAIIMENSIKYYYTAYRNDIKPYVKSLIRISGEIKTKVYIPFISIIRKILH